MLEDIGKERKMMGIKNVIAKLQPDIGIQIRTDLEVERYRRRVGAFTTDKIIRAINKCTPAEWWSAYGMQECPKLAPIAVIILSQTMPGSNCERNWTTFTLIHTRPRNRLKMERLMHLLFCHYNMQLRERNLKRSDTELIDLDEIFHDDDPLQPWIREKDKAVLDDSENEWLNDIDSDDPDSNPSSASSGGSGGHDPNNDSVGSPERESSENERPLRYREIRQLLSGNESQRRGHTENTHGRSRQAANFNDGVVNSDIHNFSEIQSSTSSSTSTYNANFDNHHQQQQNSWPFYSMMSDFFGSTELQNLYSSHYHCQDDSIEPARHRFWQ